jgi:hypothetical protein
VQSNVQVAKASCVLVKLLVDLWLATPPREAAALVAPLLHAALREAAPARRARAFDLLYNLALHAHMLEPEAGFGTGGEHNGNNNYVGASVAVIDIAERRRMQPRVVSCAAGLASAFEEVNEVWHAPLCTAALATPVPAAATGCGLLLVLSMAFGADFALYQPPEIGARSSA